LRKPSFKKDQTILKIVLIIFKWEGDLMEEKKAHCAHCASENVYGMSRVVGYFTRINNWNAGKQAEFKDRQKGNYEL
jgi:anaerobic ribonucleoside-triphosphate reductase